MFFFSFLFFSFFLFFLFFHDLFSECVFPEENQQPILGGHCFPMKSGNMKQQIHILQTKTNEKLLRSAPLTIIILVE